MEENNLDKKQQLYMCVSVCFVVFIRDEIFENI
jgi:hypothetical protein